MKKRKYRNKTPEEQRITRIRSYGISVEQYNYLLEEQNKVCWICNKNNSSKKSLNIDHDHKTGQVRGLLCGKCNTALGLLQEDPHILLRAYEYLNKPITWEIEWDYAHEKAAKERRKNIKIVQSEH